MDNRKIAIGLGLVAATTAAVLIYKNRNNSAKPTAIIPGGEIPPEEESDPTATADSIWEKARRHGWIIPGNKVFPWGGGRTNWWPADSFLPNVKITGFEITDVYATPYQAVYQVDYWIAQLAAGEDNVTTEESGLPAEVGTRVGQLCGHTWGAQLRVYQWDGNQWVKVFDGFLGPNQGWGHAPDWILGEGLITVTAEEDWVLSANTTFGGGFKPTGWVAPGNSGVGWGGKLLIKREYFTEWLALGLERVLLAGETTTIPILLVATPSNPSSYIDTSTMYKAGQKLSGSYDFSGGLGATLSIIAYKPEWYNPITSKDTPMLSSEMGIIWMKQNGIEMPMWPTGIKSDTLFCVTYLGAGDISNSCRKLWFWSYPDRFVTNPPAGFNPEGNQPRFELPEPLFEIRNNNAGSMLVSFGGNNFTANITEYGEQSTVAIII